MPLSLGHLLCRLRPREFTGFVAVVVALALAGAPAVADPGQFLDSLAPTEQPTPPGEDPDDAVPDAVHCPRPAPVRAGSPLTGDRRADGPVAAPPSSHPHPANPARSAAPADPSGSGAGVRLRC